MKKLLFCSIFILGVVHPHIKKVDCMKCYKEATLEFDKKILDIKPDAIEPTFNKVKCILDNTKPPKRQTKGFNKKIRSCVQKYHNKLNRCHEMQKQYRNHIMGKMCPMVLKDK